MRDKNSLVHWDHKQCEKGGKEAINKTGLDYFTMYFCQSGVFLHSLVQCIMAAKPIKTLELYYPMIMFSIMREIPGRC